MVSSQTSDSGLVVIGGGQASTQLIEVARQEGYGGPITLITEEPVLPYQRPPLSKQYLGGSQGQDWLLYRPADFYPKNRVDVHLGSRALSIDRAQRQVILYSGERIPYGKLALATGTRAALLDVPGGDHPNVFYIRTLADVERLKPLLGSLNSIAIVGAGFIGLEAAAVLVKMGKKVDVLARHDRVLPRLYCEPVSRFLQDHHQRQGVNFALRTSVASIEAPARGQLKVISGDGSVFPCDAVIVGIGAIPNTELAQAAGLDCDNGIVVDEFAVTSDPDILAAGDCTNHPNPFARQRLRLETVHNAVEQGRTAGFTIAGKAEPYRQTPWVWSDQFKLRIQSVGIPDGVDQEVVRGSIASGQFSVFQFRGGQLIAATMVNQPLVFGATRRILNERIPLTPDETADSCFDLQSLPKKRARLDFDVPWPTRFEKARAKSWGHG